MKTNIKPIGVTRRVRKGKQLSLYVSDYIYEELMIMAIVKAAFDGHAPSISDTIRHCVSHGMDAEKRSIGIENDDDEILSTTKPPRWCLIDTRRDEIDRFIRNPYKNNYSYKLDGYNNLLRIWLSTNDFEYIIRSTEMTRLCKEFGLKVPTPVTKGKK